LQWYGHALGKEDTDWVKKYMEYEVEGMDRGCAKRLPSMQFEQGGCYG